MKARTMGALALSGALLLALGYRVGRARADGIPRTTPLLYGGFLEEGGAPVTGTRDITLRLWDAASGGLLACAETTAAATPVTAGEWRVAIDASCVEAVQRTPDLWVETLVGGTSFGRTKIGAVPYAVEAARAAGASGALATQLASIQNSVITTPALQGSDTLMITRPGRYLVTAQARVIGTCERSPCSCSHSVDAAGVGTITYRYSHSGTGAPTTTADVPQTRMGIISVLTGSTPRMLRIQTETTTDQCRTLMLSETRITAIAVP